MTSPDTEFISILGAAGRPEAPSRVSSSSLPQTLPILGLSDIVIFPGMVAPLLVESGQSIKLIDDVVGGAARLLEMLKFPDNTVRVMVEGLWRVRIKDYTATDPYLLANFELLKDITES